MRVKTETHRTENRLKLTSTVNVQEEKIRTNRSGSRETSSRLKSRKASPRRLAVV